MTTSPPETAAPLEALEPPKRLPALVRQAHGGALYTGGVRGNKGGRPPSVLRDVLRRDLGALLPTLKRIAKGRPPRKGEPAPSMADQLKAVEILAKYGLGAMVELSTEHVQERLRRTAEAIDRRLPPDLADPLIAELRAIWA